MNEVRWNVVAAFVSVGVSVGFTILSSHYGWFAPAKAAAISDRLDALEQHEAVLFSAQKAVRDRLDTLDHAPPAANAPAPAPSGGWWCYSGRECFRSMPECTKTDAARQAECKQAPSAWCGAADAKECFASSKDCEAAAHKPCVQVP